MGENAANGMMSASSINVGSASPSMNATRPNCGMPGAMWRFPYEDEGEGYCYFPAVDDASLIVEETVPAMTTATDLTARIYAALSKRDMPAAAVLINALHRIDPDAAHRITNAIDEVDAKYAARRGAERIEATRLDMEYADERADWWR